jgi:hypothetical protein
MRPGSVGTAGAPKLGIGPGISRPDGGAIGGGSGVEEKSGESNNGPSPIMGPAAPMMGAPPPQLLQHSHGQAARERNILLRENMPPPSQLPQGLAHPAASKTPASVAVVAKRNRFMCGPLVAIIPERELKTGVGRTTANAAVREPIMRQEVQRGKPT